MKKIVITGVLCVLFTLWGLAFYWHQTDMEQLTRYLKEDGYLEWLGFLLLLSASFFMYYVTFSQVAEGQLEIRSRKFLVMFGMATLFLLGAGEEISWAQRLTGHASSEFFNAHNAQAETNFHNLKVNGVKLNKLIFGKILFLMIFIHNIVLPLLARKKESVLKFVKSWGGFLAPLPATAGFVLVAILVDLVKHDRHKEIIEVAGSLHYYSAVFMCYGMGYLNDKPFFKADSQKRAGQFFVAHLGLLLLLAYILSTGVRQMKL